MGGDPREEKGEGLPCASSPLMREHRRHVAEGVDLMDHVAEGKGVHFMTPGAAVGDIDSAQAVVHSRPDVGTDGVADHPRLIPPEPALQEEAGVGGGVLLRHHAELVKILPEAGDPDLARLLLPVPLGQEKELIPGGKLFERLLHARERDHGVVEDPLFDLLDQILVFTLLTPDF